MRVKEILDMVSLEVGDPTFSNISSRIAMLKISHAADRLAEALRRGDPSYGLATYTYSGISDHYVRLPSNFRRLVALHYVDAAGNEGDPLEFCDKRNSNKFLYRPWIEGRNIYFRTSAVSSVKLYYHPEQPPMAIGYVGAGSTESAVVFGDAEYGTIISQDDYCVGAPLTIFGTNDEDRTITTYNRNTSTATLDYDLSSAPSEDTQFEIGPMIGPGHHLDLVELSSVLIMRDYLAVRDILARVAGESGNAIQGPVEPLYQEY